MVQTRRAAQLAATDNFKHASVSAESPNKEEHPSSRPLKRVKRARQASQQASPASDLEQNRDTAVASSTSTKPPRKARQKKEQVVPKPSDFASRVASAWKVGAHVSAAGGVENTVVNAARVGANAFALFVKSQRKWASPPLTDENVSSFKARMKEFGYDPKHVLPHGSYLVNLGNPDLTKREKSYECFLDDLQRCEQLGLVYYNFHPGSTVGNATKEESISLIAECINKAHRETPSVVTVIENMSGAKNIVGSQFTELGGIIEQVEDKSRVGVCLDTCHMYAAGYDISTKAGWDETMTTFDREVGLSYLRGMHLNDSKAPLGSKKDRHENIGLGTLGLSAFLTILSDPRVQNIPLILETPTFEAVEVWECEIKVLNALSEAVTSSGANVNEEMLKGMVSNIQGIIQEYRGHGKKSTSGRDVSRLKAKRGKRKKTESEEESQATGSDGESCAEHSE